MSAPPRNGAQPAGSDHRFGTGGCHRSDEFFVDLFSNQLKPRFGASRAIVEVFNLRLQQIYPIFGGSKITRQLICQGLSALTSVVRQVGCLLKHGNDGESGLLQRIAVEPPLFLRCKFEDPFSNVNRALIYGCRLRTPPRVTVQRPGIPLPLEVVRGRLDPSAATCVDVSSHPRKSSRSRNWKKMSSTQSQQFVVQCRGEIGCAAPAKTPKTKKIVGR